MIKCKISAIVISGFFATSALAQSADRVDPATGNYVPVRDAFSADDPTADQANPNRLNNRVGQRAQAGRTRESRSATQSIVPPAPSQTDDTAKSSVVQMPTSSLASMPGMALYDQTDRAPNDPFTKPDWWPK